MMKQLGKKFTALLLAAMMALSLAAVASAAAAPAANTSYSVTVQADKILFTRNGASASYPIKTANLKLTTHKDGDLLVSFTDSTGKARNVTVGKQTSLTLSGPMASLTLAKELNDGVAVTLGATANVTTMTVDTPNPVAVNGKVGTLKVTAAANITLAKGATVTKKDVTSKTAKVTTSQNAAVTAAPTAAAATPAKPAATVKPSAPAKPAASSSASSDKGDYRIKISAIYWDDEDATLGDVLDELNDNLEVYDYTTRTYLAGDAKWTTSNNRTVQDGKSYSFVFTPDDKTYEEATSSVKIYTDSASGDITLELKSPGYLVAKDGDVKLKSLKSDLKKLVRANNDDGDDVSGTVTWVSNDNNTIDNGRSYTYKFKPSNSRYDSEEGSVTVYIEGQEPKS